MADDYLKSFTDGEAILANDTNNNNQYLLTQITSSINSFRVEVEQMMANFSGNFIQPGFILALPYSTIPVGYLKCDGSSLLIADYEDLYNVIGTTYGYIDDYHFNLPDLQGKFLRGFGGNSASIGTLQESAAPNITGRFGSGIGGFSGAFASYSGGYNPMEAGPWVSNQIASFDASRSSSVYKNGLDEVRPDNYAVNWIIKY